MILASLALVLPNFPSNGVAKIKIFKLFQRSVRCFGAGRRVHTDALSKHPDTPLSESGCLATHPDTIAPAELILFDFSCDFVLIRCDSFHSLFVNIMMLIGLSSKHYIELIIVLQSFNSILSLLFAF